jgi:GT2 family glycosyltransferase
VEEVFSPCAAAALYPKQEFLNVGGFDEEYFSYHEDIDLGFRLRLKGLRSYYLPEAVVHHVGSASTGKKSPFSIYYGHRNLEWTYYKNMPLLLFWIFFPLHLLVNIFFFIYFTLLGHGKVILRAKRDALMRYGKMRHKRRAIQASRIASTKDIYEALNRDLFAPLKATLQRRNFSIERDDNVSNS